MVRIAMDRAQRLWICFARLKGANLMSRRKVKQVDAIRQKALENVIEEFLRHCRLKNLSPRTLEYYEEDLNYFQRSVPVESVREVTREVMEDFIDHEMSSPPPLGRPLLCHKRLLPCVSPIMPRVWPCGRRFTESITRSLDMGKRETGASVGLWWRLRMNKKQQPFKLRRDTEV